ncbi:SDR family oxidoreductase [Sinorhizobium sp. BG8]|uniref:SDR family NAD(P)-dependent oxidoreductase n=1 Tax=Sinorhizobium sp. BG8 TaxID=2613773 RepID=UPI00193CFEBF|nr:SDR family oxidoreductase [Sinorhizobium sp. BG8]QRM56278.1 SDR family oxidoreductase [Sinorhizobium sp. BG8]
MLLANKVAIIHGAAGAIGAATAQAFAREGAELHLAGRTGEKVEALAAAIRADGGRARGARVDALDEREVERHAEAVVERAGRIDIVFNAVAVEFVQGKLLTDLTPMEFEAPITGWTRTQFLTARAAARHMQRQGSGTILTLSASPARLAIAMTSGFGVACAAVEALTRTLAAELGPSGVRAVCLRPHRIGETIGDDPDLPMSMAEFCGFLSEMTLLKRLPTLDDVANVAAFLASDHARSMTGAVANLTAGMSVD